MQLKVLQSLPQLLQNYGDTLQGDLQSSLLQVCATLQQTKAITVSSTASAILQQIISLLFEKVENEDGRKSYCSCKTCHHAEPAKTNQRISPLLLRFLPKAGQFLSDLPLTMLTECVTFGFLKHATHNICRSWKIYVS